MYAQLFCCTPCGACLFDGAKNDVYAQVVSLFLRRKNEKML